VTRSDRSVVTLLDDDGHPAPEPIRPTPPSPGGSRRRIVLLAVAVLIVAAVVYDVATISSNHQGESALRKAVARAGRAHTVLAATTAEVATAKATVDARDQAGARTADEITSTQQHLKTATQTVGLQSVDVTSLQTCLTGVSSAVSAFAASNPQGAISSITAASSACLAIDGTGGGLSYPFDFPDPFIITVGSEYFAFGTNSVAGNIQIIESSDLTHWTSLGEALPEVAAWAQPGATLAPSVLEQGGNYVLYYSALDGTTGEQCISEAVADQPQGPYVDSSQTPLVCQLTLGGSIDPSAFVGADGNDYLTWTSQGATGQPSTIWSQQLTSGGTALAPGPPSQLLAPSQGWQGGVVEGPDMFVSGGQYFLFYSANNWQSASYAIGVTDCSGPLGPCAAPSAQPLLVSDQSMSGPGGPSVFADAEGNPWLAFDAWLPGKVGFPNSRPLFLRSITITGGAVQVEP
jgi:hypothetical protein